MADVKMKHPEASRQITVRPDEVPMYLTQGWERVESSQPAKAAKKATAKKAAAPPAEPTPA